MVCQDCGFVFADLNVWKDPYSQTDYYDLSNQPKEDYPLRPQATERDRIASVLRHQTSGRLMDYGGGLGRTALAAHEKGFQATVLEDSELAVERGRTHHPEIEWIHQSVIGPEIPDESFDVVTMFHVLEHLPDVHTPLDSIYRVLKPGGVFCVEVPNYGSNLRKLQGVNWSYIMDHHVNYFEPSTLNQLITSKSFEKLEVYTRRTFGVNERQKWKEPLKQVLCWLGFGDVVRGLYRKH